MSGLSKERMTKRRTVQYDLRPLAAGAKVWKGGLAMVVTAGANAGYYEAANTSDTGIVVGTYEEDVDNTAGGNGALSANVHFFHERLLEGLDNDTGTPVTAAMRETPCYALDDHTATGAPNNTPLGIVYDATTSLVWVEGRAVPPQVEQEPVIQSGTGALTLGVLSVAAGVTITANSRIIATRKTAGGTTGSTLEAPSADRTVGGPGVGAFKIRSFDDTGAITTDTSTLDWVIVG